MMSIVKKILSLYKFIYFVIAPKLFFTLSGMGNNWIKHRMIFGLRICIITDYSRQE